MKKSTGHWIVVLLLLFVGALYAKDVHVKGYYRKDGTYVQPHMRSSPNHTKNDNFSTRGNVNPYTGKAGTKPGDGGSTEDSARSGAGEQGSGATASGDGGIASASGAYAPSNGAVTVVQDERRRVGWAAVKSGMTMDELKGQLGEPVDSKKQGSFDVLNFPSGTVFVKEGRVVAWRKVKTK